MTIQDNRPTVSTIRSSKHQKKLTMITAYDALFANLFSDLTDMILVGDSLNMSFAGQKDTLSVTLDQMIYHTKAVCQGAPHSLVILDMPFGSYTNEQQALSNAVRVYQETKASAIKLEGGSHIANTIKTLTHHGIAVMGHIGLMPQHVRSEGKYKVQGRTESDINSLIKDAKAIEKSGAFALVVEGVKPHAAKQITDSIDIPVIGIGAGQDTDGQVLVWSDMLGLFESFKPKFVKQYLNGSTLVKQAVCQYIKEVQEGTFPSKDHHY